MVGVAQLVELRIVIPAVVGSIPIVHPIFFTLLFSYLFRFYTRRDQSAITDPTPLFQSRYTPTRLIPMHELPAPIPILLCATPQAWLEQALSNLPTLLIDHANCEKKAASTAMNLMFRYVDRTDLLIKMSQLAREELLHFEQVVSLMDTMDIEYQHLTASGYAAGLREPIRTHEPAKLVDTLIVGAFVEARSCERFAALIPSLEGELQRFYRSLLKSEYRHYEDYLELAHLYAGEDISERVKEFAELEKILIERPDPEFRFHSGTPSHKTG